MSAVADEAGVALGTLYHYFSGKEALIRWALWRAFDPEVQLPDELPIEPPRGTLEEQIAPMMDLPEVFPKLHSPVPDLRSGPAGLARGLHEVVEELYLTLEEGRRLIDLVEAATVDDESLGQAWFSGMVEQLLVIWADYIQMLRSACALEPLERPELAARFVITNCTFFARAAPRRPARRSLPR